MYSTNQDRYCSKVQLMVSCLNSLKIRGASVFVIQGIDPFSLDALAKAGIVALRRAKRRNMER